MTLRLLALIAALMALGLVGCGFDCERACVDSVNKPVCSNDQIALADGCDACDAAMARNVLGFSGSTCHGTAHIQESQPGKDAAWGPGTTGVSWR